VIFQKKLFEGISEENCFQRKKEKLEVPPPPPNEQDKIKSSSGIDRDKEKPELKENRQRVKAFAYDFSTLTKSSDYDVVIASIKALGDISVLINNVGGNNYVGEFEKESTDEIESAIRVNLLPFTYITRGLVSVLAARKPAADAKEGTKAHSAIICLGNRA